MLLAVFGAYLISATFGFGDALILLPLLSIFIDVEIAIIFTGFWGFPQAIQQIIKYHRLIDRYFLKWFLPSVIPGIVLGIFLMLYLQTVWIELMIAVFILGYVAYQFYQTFKAHSKKLTTPPLNTPEMPNIVPKENTISQGHPALLLSSGFVYGTISSWVGTPGPISIMALELTHHRREHFIANNTAIVVVAGSLKLSLYVINGLFPIEYLGFFLGGLGLCLLATRLGHYLTPKIPIAKVQIIISTILSVVGIKMFIQSLQSLWI